MNGEPTMSDEQPDTTVETTAADPAPDTTVDTTAADPAPDTTVDTTAADPAPDVAVETTAADAATDVAPAAPTSPPAVSTPPPPRPTPAMVPRRPAAAPTLPALPAPSAEAMAFGRVDDEGTVYVRTADGERAVGSHPGATPAESLAHFARKYDEIVGQLNLFEQRLAVTDVPVSEVDSGLAKLRTATTDPDVVGDVDALVARVQALAPLAAARKAAADAARNRARDEARTRRTALVEEAEQIAGTDAERMQWRASGQRMKDIFEQWRADQKADVRLDRPSQEDLWKRFTHARTAFDRKRRQHFAALDETQGEARSVKEKLAVEAEALVTSTDWAPTATAFKKLMDRWREAGRAGRKDDDALWARFRTSQDTFFAARHAQSAEQDQEFAANLGVRLALIREAEGLLPVKDLVAAKTTLREIQGRYEAAGKVPRADVESTERRMRAVEQAVRDVEDTRWTSRNPEGEARARSAVEQLEATISDLSARRDKAAAAGDARRLADAEAAIAAREEWLEQARAALRDFSG